MRGESFDFRDVAEYLSQGCTDEEFAELFVLFYLMNKESKPKDVRITKEVMKSTSTDAIAAHIKAILNEIIFSEEIDPDAWWKQKEKLA